MGAPRAIHAQPAKRLAIFHYADPPLFEKQYPGFFAALAEKGWREKSTLAIDWREVRMDDPKLDELAARLAATAPDVLFTESTRGTRALQNATRTIPIVTSVGDPVASRFATSLQRPGGNITGLALTAGTEGKALDFARELVPNLKRIAGFVPASVATSREQAQPGLKAANDRGIEARLWLIDPRDAQAAAREAQKWGAGAVSVGVFLDKEPTRIVTEAVHAAGLPTINGVEWFPELFALTVVTHHLNPVRSLVAILDKILRGARPADIGFEPPDSVDITVNRRILASLRLPVPPALALRANQFID